MTEFDWLQLLNPEFYINFEIGGLQVGLFLILFIVFAETGLFAGFFLPGDSLLFLAGIYNRELVEHLLIIKSEFGNVAFLAFLVSIAGILGNMFGYWFGVMSGEFLYKKEDGLLFKKKYLTQSKDFFEHHGGKAIIYSRFLPIFRTFAPIVSGIAKMNKKKFMLYNVLSSFMWSYSLIFAGHYLYSFFLSTFDIDIKKHIHIIIIILITATVIPVILKLRKKN